MSFNDLATGRHNVDLERGNSRLNTSTSGSETAFSNLQSSLSVQVFKINANVQGINRLVDQLGTSSDNGTTRKTLHDLTESTRAMVKRGTDDLKKLATLQANLPHHKAHLQKISHDFQVSLVAFQRAQKVSAEKQRTVVDVVKQAVEDDEARAAGERAPSSPRRQMQMQLQVQQLSPAELAFQESLIQEREAEIREIESGIHELNEIFRDLGTLVVEQGEMLDNIEQNVTSVSTNTAGAAEELATASEYQRKAGRRAACLMIIMAIVICIVLLAILS